MDRSWPALALSGLWCWSSGTWKLLSNLNDQTLVAAPDGSIVAGFGSSGLWRWSNGAWKLLSHLTDRTLVALADGSIVAGFGSSGLWCWSSGTWKLLSNLNDQTLVACAGRLNRGRFRLFGSVVLEQRGLEIAQQFDRSDSGRSRRMDRSWPALADPACGAGVAAPGNCSAI